MNVMKRVEAVIKSDKLSEVVSAMRNAGAKGVSVTQVKGQGSGERPMIRGGRGTTQYRAEYNTMDSVMTIVEDSEVQTIIDAINGTARSGNSGDGIIVVSDVTQVVNIASQSSGSEAL